MKQSKQFTPQKDSQSPVMVGVEQHQLFSGPLPPPEMLKAYKGIDGNFPERMMKIAEKHAEADVRGKDRMSFATFVAPLVGQALSFFLGLTGLGLCAFLATKGLGSESIVAAIGGIAPIIVVALSNLKKK
jgi:uncharacterized membrane protein